MKYEQSKNKIKKTWERTERNESDLKKLKRLNIKPISNYNFKSILKYETEWISTYEAPDRFYITLPINFPELYLSTLNINVIARTNEAHKELFLSYANDYIEIYDQSRMEEFWEFGYIIRAEQDEDDVKYYIMFDKPGYFDIGNYYPLELKFILTFTNPLDYEKL